MQKLKVLALSKRERNEIQGSTRVTQINFTEGLGEGRGGLASELLSQTAQAGHGRRASPKNCFKNWK